MSINIASLPPAQEIDQSTIAKAAQHYAAAQAALRDAQKALQSAWQDRDNAETAAKEGRPAPSGSLVEHVQAVDGLQRKVGAAIDTVNAAANALEAAVERHGEAWAATYEQRAAALDEQWERAVVALIELHGERTAVNRRRRTVFGVGPTSASVLKFRPERVFDDITGDKIELAYNPDPNHRRKLLIGVRLDDALAALAALGQPIESPAPAFDVADQLVKGFDHARTAARGYSVTEARAGNGLNVDGVPIYFPEPIESD